MRAIGVEMTSMGVVPMVEYEVSYWVDARDDIVAVSGGWSDFARENQGTDLEEERVIGRNLLKFIRGDTTRMYMAALLQAARLQAARLPGTPIVRPYRCDSPEMRRYMEMRLSSDEVGRVRVEHRLKRVEPMRRPMAFEEAMAPEVARVTRCSMCQRLNTSGGWSEPDETDALEMPASSPLPVTYGICDDCAERVSAQ